MNDQKTTLTLDNSQTKTLIKTARELAGDLQGLAKLLEDNLALGKSAPISGKKKASKPGKPKTGKTSGKSKIGKSAKAQTPMGEAQAPSEDPENGVSYSSDKLGQMNRRDLSAVAKKMGLDPKGKLSPDLRQIILDAQGGGPQTVSNKGTCDVTGDENVLLKEMIHADETYHVGPRVLAALELEAELCDLLSGDDDVSNYEDDE